MSPYPFSFDESSSYPLFLGGIRNFSFRRYGGRICGETSRIGGLQLEGSGMPRLLFSPPAVVASWREWIKCPLSLNIRCSQSARRIAVTLPLLLPEDVDCGRLCAMVGPKTPYLSRVGVFPKDESKKNIAHHLQSGKEANLTDILTFCQI